MRIYQVLAACFYIWVLTEGALRKWFLNSLATPLFFVKYLFVILFVLILFVNRFKISKNDYPFIGFFFFFIFYGIVQIFNLRVTDTIIMGIIGNVVHFGFSICFFLLPLALVRKKQLFKIFPFFNFLLAGIFILGMVQYFSPPSSFINKYVSDDMTTALVGEHVRITGVFSYIATYASFLGFAVLMLFFQLLRLKKVSWYSIFLLVTFFLGIINAFMSGSRGLVFLLAGQAILAFFLYAMQEKSEKLIKFGINGLLILTLGYAVISYTEQGSIAFESFAGRVSGNSDVEGRLYDALDPFKFLDQSGLIGFGIGSTYQGNGQFITQRWKMPGFFEEESERIVIELGLLGFLLSLLFRWYVFFYSLTTYRNTTDKDLKVLALILTIYQLPVIFYLNQATFNWMENLMYFTSIGLLVFINKTEKRDQIEAAQSARLTAG